MDTQAKGLVRVPGGDGARLHEVYHDIQSVMQVKMYVLFIPMIFYLIFTDCS
jgi:hypothetical protein